MFDEEEEEDDEEDDEDDNEDDDDSNMDGNCPFSVPPALVVAFRFCVFDFFVDDFFFLWCLWSTATTMRGGIRDTTNRLTPSYINGILRLH